MQHGTMIAMLSMFVCLVALWIVWLVQARRKAGQNSSQVDRSGTWETEARDLAGRGEKISAIKRVREGTGLGLADAKNLVESWGAPLRGAGASGGSAEAEARELARQGHTIPAVKMVREYSGLGLKEALDLVKSWEGSQPGGG